MLPAISGLVPAAGRFFDR